MESLPSLSSTIQPGILNFPGSTPESKRLTEELLKTDEENHHCYFVAAGFHNHLSHHLLAAYDLGAPVELIQAIYDDEAKDQRPIDLNVNGVIPDGSPKAGDIRDQTWTNWLGDQKAYAAYVHFFTKKVGTLGVEKTLENYVFSPMANGNGAYMLLRVVGGAVHPFIQIGYGLEFSSEVEVVAGLAQAAIHEARSFCYLPFDKFVDAEITDNETENSKGRQPKRGPSVLYILRQLYDSPKLVPKMPYDPNALLSKRMKDFMEGGVRQAELNRIMSQFDPGQTDEELEERIEELTFLAILLTFGTGRPNRKPRLDFFLMHMLTSSIFLPSYMKAIKNIQFKRELLRAYIQVMGYYLMVRGRPRINPTLIMSYTDNPLPPDIDPNKVHVASKALGPSARNPWPAMVEDVIHAPDSHTVKSLRTLIYGSLKFGRLRKGEMIGVYDPEGKETHEGIAQVDGTVFVRAAGILMDTLGWVTHGQEVGHWDRSALGWDDAWKNEDP
ncbi:hypothetical protein M422DRAFT_780500 [Sphaerobolus stellatus SS14]|uniref:Unplaced genomic scaffold SPHSTscaffold_64, whole genome shotgun sequence n=1 Tax=Sphaerobolus stellatus (strain SS14) TaxID=990650 RepID=A0A0C9VRU0_SPHS4|nr:hypothetical protein M422DRAFT_780500 [Sphaerobolus stellatus SS14]